MTIRTIAIIGAGPSGLAVARALIAENAFQSIHIFDQNKSVGGTWNYEPIKPGHPPVPSTSPWLSPDDPSMGVSPMYKNLETNIPNYIMEYKGFHFPENTPPFPSRTSVLKYVQDYAQKYLSGGEVTFSLHTLVQSVQKIDNNWIVTVKELSSSSSSKLNFDAVILATGHYRVPYIPDVDGLKEWAEADRSSVSHAKYFVDASTYKNKRVLVIGNAPSGVDISTQLIATAKAPVYRSIKTAGPPGQPKTEFTKDVAEVVRYDYKNNRSVLLKDGTSISEIDDILFCTGYLYSFPYLKSYIEGSDAIINDGTRVRRLYKQIFYIPDPTLATVCMPFKIIPMPMAESQGAIAARVFSGRLSLPSENEMRESEKSELEKTGDVRAYHDLGYPKDVEYSRGLHRWASKAEPRNVGFMAELWDEQKEIQRSSSDLKNKSLELAISLAEQSREAIEVK